MLEALKSFFRSSMMPEEEPEPENRDREVRLAACALLLELAHVDDDFSADERRHLKRAIRRHFGLDKEQADELLRYAERARQTATDLFQFTNLIRENYSLGQKMVLVEVMWGLVYSDGKLSNREDYLMRKVSHLLGLKMAYLSEARKRYEQGRPAQDGAPPVD